MKLDAPANINYSATLIRVPAIVELPGLNNLVGVPILGHQALTTRGVEVGDLRVVFTAETQLSEEYASENDLYRDTELNKTDATGYLDRNRRVRALKLRGHVSNALLMPLSSLEYTGVDLDALAELASDRFPLVLFDTLDGKPICKKYEVPVKAGTRAASKIVKAFKRVDAKFLPEHLDTDAYHRSRHLLKSDREAVISQKIHGTSWRGGRVPCRRQLKWYEKLLRKLGVQIPEYEFDVVFGSRKVIKDPKSVTQDHYYSYDLWTEYGKKVADLIPDGYLVYGEIVGWTKDGAELQKNYTYQVPKGEAELYVYRVATVNTQGTLSDLSWDGVKDFCRARGLKWVPELKRIHVDDIDGFLDMYLDQRIADFGGWADWPLVVSSHKTVDEGFCIRQEGQVPVILKSKSSVFLEHETKILDAGELDLESVA